MALSWAQDALAVLSGSAVGFSLGLIGGGGSILAVPLLLYVVGIGDAHVAIGTSALAVSLNAFGNLDRPLARRQRQMALRCDIRSRRHCRRGDRVVARQARRRPKLLFLFALAMIAVGVAMLRPRAADGRSRSSA